MLIIDHLSMHEPPRAAFDAVQANERNVGLGALMVPAARFALPRGRGRIEATECARLTRSSPAMLPIAPPGQSQSDLAITALEALVERVGKTHLSATTHIVFAHATLNQQVVESVAGRLQHMLGIDHVLPLALGQCGTLGLMAALPLAEGLLRDGGQVLFVAADKWLYPFFRVYGDFVAYGDSAAALLVRRALPSESAHLHAGGIRLLGHSLTQGDVIDDPWAMSPHTLEARLMAPLLRAALQALDDADVAVSEIDCFAPAGFSASFRAMLAARMVIPRERLLARDAAHLSSADAIASLALARATMHHTDRRRVLVCDAALAGGAGAFVAELHGTPAAGLH
jgi:3-oxoacyl-[acyl-carrier-protein] synthase III